MSKKILSLLCVAAMVLMLVSCTGTAASSAASKASSADTSSAASSAKPKDPVTLTLWFRNNVGEQEDTAKVAQKLTEQLSKMEGYKHITMELHPCKDYATDFALAQASHVQLDLVSTPGLKYTTEVENGSFIVMDDLLAQNPDVSAELPDWLMELGKVDGKTYMVPNQQQAANQYYFSSPKEYVDHSGYTVDQIRDIFQKGTASDKVSFMEKYMVAIRTYTGKNTKWFPSAIADWKIYVNPSNNLGTISSNDSLYWDTASNKLLYVNTNQDVVNGFAKTAEFFQQGYMHPDNATINGNNFIGKNYLNDESFIFNFVQDAGSEDFVANKLTAANGFDMVAILVADHCFVTNSWAAGGMAISSTSKNQEDAMSVIALLENSKYSEFYNTLCFGLEDKHYTKTGDNTIKTLEFDGSQGNAECSYTCWKWTVGNTFNAWLNQSQNADQLAYIKNEINNGSKTEYSPLMGLSFKTADIGTEISQVATVSKEYLNTLKQGIKGADEAAYYADYLTHLKVAGLDKILENLNKQVADFITAKK